MKRILPLLAAVVLTGIFMPAEAAAQKFGTVDMNKAFNSYYKTKEAEAKINEARASAKTEFDERMESYKKALDAINKLNEEMSKPELSKEMKDEKAKARDERIAESKDLERQINEFRVTRERQLQEQAMRMRNGIVEEINKVVQDIVKSRGFELVFDKSGPSINGVPVLVYSRDDMDFTDLVIETLNKNKPKDAPAAGGGEKKN